MPNKVTTTAEIYDFRDIAFLFEFAMLEADLRFSDRTSADATGLILGILPVDIEAEGRGFNQNLTKGVVEKVTFAFGDVEIKITSGDISLAGLSNAARQENNGNTGAIEKFLMRQDWNLNFTAADDFAPADMLVGDGQVEFNLRGDDVVKLGRGDDFFFVGDGDDRAFGAGGNDFIEGGRGRDDLFGGQGRDGLLGGSSRDLLKGGANNDNLFGGAGADELHGGRQKDALTGGRGSDVFVFRTGDGKDTVTDFDARDNDEEIDLSAVKSIRSFNDLSKNHMSQAGDDVVIDDNNGLEITLRDTSLSDLQRGDFIF